MGLELRANGIGYRINDSEVRVQGLIVLRFKGFKVRFQCSGFVIWLFSVTGSGFRV